MGRWGNGSGEARETAIIEEMRLGSQATVIKGEWASIKGDIVGILSNWGANSDLLGPCRSSPRSLSLARLDTPPQRVRKGKARKKRRKQELGEIPPYSNALHSCIKRTRRHGRQSTTSITEHHNILDVMRIEILYSNQIRRQMGRS